MKIGFIGLGNMGGPMVANLLEGGHELTVCDVRKEAAAAHVEAGAGWAETPAAAAAGAEVVFTSLPGPAQVESVSLGEDGLLGALESGATYFDMTTGSPTLVRRLNELYAERGVQMLDAPVSGGPDGAAVRKLAIFAGGDRATFDRHVDLLREIGDQPVYIGASGSGTVVKLVHNCAAFQVDAAIAEVFTLGVKAGVEPLDLWRGLRQSYLGRRRTFDGLKDQFLPGEFDEVRFTVALGHKDVTLATDLARELSVPTRIADLTLADMTEAMNRGWGERDCRAPMLLQEERSQTQIAVPVDEVEAVFAEDSAT